MARKIDFVIDGTTYNSGLAKVDRKKIYGWSKVAVFDEADSECKLAGIADGSIVLPSGSTALVKLGDSGEYVSGKELVGVDSEGRQVEMVPSVYDAPVELKEAALEEYMSLAVKTVYQLDIEEGKDALLKELSDGKTYYFVFNYRADFEGDDAFLISNGTDVFAIVGQIADFEFIGLNDNEQELAVDESETEAEDDLDFAMF